jgi:4-diphosphocytidyl-2-C-methyl-D-erythritol kinase
MTASGKSITLPAFAKVNLDLRILGVRADGYHDLRTIFQSLLIHDLITFTRVQGAFSITCDDPKLPTDRRNLIWKAASLLWRTAGRSRGDTPRNVSVELKKRIPSEAGLGGGSADAAVALLGLAAIWGLDVDLPTLSRLATSIGADVPFFLVGGTALGLGRGDDIYPLTDLPRSYAVIVRPRFGVSSAEAYTWYDTETRPISERSRRAAVARGHRSGQRLLPDHSASPHDLAYQDGVGGGRGHPCGHVRFRVRRLWPVRSRRCCQAHGARSQPAGLAGALFTDAVAC